MKIKILYKVAIALLITSLIFSSCINNQKEEGFVINGEIFDAEFGSVAMLRRNPITNKVDSIAHDTIIDGKFTLTGNIDCPSVCYLRFVVDVEYKDAEGKTQSIKAAYTGHIIADNVTMDFEAWVRDIRNCKVWGNELHTKVLQLVKDDNDLNNLNKNQEAIYRFIFINKNKLSAEEKADLTEQWQEEIKKFSEKRKEIIDSKLKSDESLLYKSLLLDTYNITGESQIELASDLIEELVLVYGEDHYLVNSLTTKLAKAKKEDKVAIGKKFIDIVSKDMDGNEIKLSSVVGEGKYVLLDFWASWCNPCRAEMPILKKDYKKFHDKGFEIFAISIDKQKGPWETASKAENFPWINTHLISEEGKNAQQAYQVSSIPDNFLIGPDGKIIARKLRGKKLEEKLNELFNN
jgi:thiol-disulfide isomerase/thioredoxin